MTPVIRLLSLPASKEMETKGTGIFKESCVIPCKTGCASAGNRIMEKKKIRHVLFFKKENEDFKSLVCLLVCLLMQIYHRFLIVHTKQNAFW
jgi:hypothetical protein